MRSRARSGWLAGGAVGALLLTGVLTSTAAPPAAAAQTITGIAYAPAEPAGSQGHLLDLYLPTSTGPTPLVIWSSGSAWLSDNGRSGAAQVANALNAKGYAVAGVSVRSSAQAKFPGQVHDVKAAIRYLRANAARYNLDPQRFAAMGDSSGGWVASMAALTGGVPELEGTLGTTGVSSEVQAGVDFFGPIDFLRMNSQRTGPGQMDHDDPSGPASQLVGCAIQTCPDRVRLANPTTYVDRDDPPMMVLHGSGDTIVPPAQSANFAAALRAACLDTQYMSVPGAGHSWSDVLSPSRWGGQTVVTTTGCQETRTTGTPNPSWDTIAAFLEKAWASGPTPTPTPTPTATPTPTVTPTPTATPTSGPGGCSASYRVVNAWPGGFVAEVDVSAGTAPVNGWSVGLTLPGGAAVTNTWNGVATGSTGTVTVGNAAWNGRLGAGHRTTFGFQATGSGTGTTVTCSAAP